MYEIFKLVLDFKADICRHVHSLFEHVQNSSCYVWHIFVHVLRQETLNWFL